MKNNKGKRNNRKYSNRLTLSEQKTTTAYKLSCEKIKTFEKSLSSTQDELEKFRGMYYESDKKHAIQISKNSTIIFHEVLKFIISTVCGGLGVNLVTDQLYGKGVGIILMGIILYTLVVFFDRKQIT